MLLAPKMEEKLRDDHDQVKKSSTKVTSSGDDPVSEEENGASNGEVIIDVIGRSRNDSEGLKAEEKVCRICHFGSEPAPLIPLGCDCRGELGLSHRHCSEAWFELKRNRLCEICGKTAKNVHVIIGNETEEVSISMMEWDEMRLAAASLEGSDERSRRCKKSFCNFVMGCLVLAFILPWFLRGNDVL